MNPLQRGCQDLLGRTIPIAEHSQQRSVGDILEGVVITEFKKCCENIPNCMVVESTSKKSTEDVKVVINNHNLYLDVKSKDIDGEFSMPNLTSVKKLKKLYEDNNNHFVLVIVHYTRNEDSIQIQQVEPVCIENIDFSCLRIGELGQGQIQLKDAGKDIKRSGITRSEWMKTLRETYMSFAVKQIVKFAETIRTMEKETW